jgi:hypothetical protein
MGKAISVLMVALAVLLIISSGAVADGSSWFVTVEAVAEDGAATAITWTGTESYAGPLDLSVWDSSIATIDLLYVAVDSDPVVKCGSSDIPLLVVSTNKKVEFSCSSGWFLDAPYEDAVASTTASLTLTGSIKPQGHSYEALYNVGSPSGGRYTGSPFAEFLYGTGSTTFSTGVYELDTGSMAPVTGPVNSMVSQWRFQLQQDSSASLYSTFTIEEANVVIPDVPEPMSILLGIMGLGSVAGFRRLRKS